MACVVTYNSAPTIGRLLISLDAEPAVSAVEIFDNASTDGTVDAIQSLSRSTSKPLTVHRSSINIGFPAACNRMLAGVSTDVVALVNPDVELNDQVLSRLVRQVRAIERIGVASCRLQTRDGRVQAEAARATPRLTRLLAGSAPAALRRAFRRMSRGQRPGFTIDRDVDCVTGAVMVFRTDLLDHVGFLDESVFMYLEDLDYCRRVKEAGFTIRYIGSAFAWHDSGVSARGLRRELNTLLPQVFLAYFRRYGTVTQRICVRPVLALICAGWVVRRVTRGQSPSKETYALWLAMSYKPSKRPKWFTVDVSTDRL